MKWDLASIARITDGRSVGDAVVTSVDIDSRRIRPGSLFVALRGDRVDGHDYSAEAVSAGAAACLVERGRLPAGVSGVEVHDPMSALSSLAAARRSELDIPVVAITGSSGKTTTKDLAAAAMGPGTHAALESYNNEIGVPLTILDTPDAATALVVEVGSRGLGHIAALTPVVRPDVAVLTNVGTAHLEMFGDVGTVLRAKWELVEGVGDGIAVVPRDLDAAHLPKPRRLLTFGEGEGADVRATEVTVDDLGLATVTLRPGDEAGRVTLPVPGRHQVSNAAAAVAAAVAVGRDFGPAVERLAAARVSRWRMEVSRGAIGGAAVTVVNDAYNANPESMAAALRTVADMSGRRLAVLGRMHELGPVETAAHVAVGELAARLGFALVVVVGDDPGIATGAGRIAVAVADAEEALRCLTDRIEPHDVVLVKASRATGLESVAAALVSEVAA
ncbi:MAG TPA: UDP-N-acetylmuramoyl-tripeptide--D-alanyl-D-alanine ligase [Acidimicrobiia bacterium]|nr:UDP-N-acetylmuramoyl-tripeptide--D-alanyl-D-alanine ligase [Acidimicrobiia bacterium]